MVLLMVTMTAALTVVKTAVMWVVQMVVVKDLLMVDWLELEWVAYLAETMAGNWEAKLENFLVAQMVVVMAAMTADKKV
jgi:hypothetical protein